MVKPFTKVETRIQTEKGRLLGKSRIYTNTTEKNRIEELERIKELKKLEKERKSKARKMKRTLSVLKEDYLKTSTQKRNETEKIAISDSDSDTDINLRESSASPFDIFEENKEDKDHSVPVNSENIKDGAFVLVKFEKKKTVLYYVG